MNFTHIGQNVHSRMYIGLELYCCLDSALSKCMLSLFLHRRS